MHFPRCLSYLLLPLNVHIDEPNPQKVLFVYMTPVLRPFGVNTYWQNEATER